MSMPVFYLSHGGGPWPWMEQGLVRYADLQRSLTALPASLPRPPKAILMVSAHWETEGPLRVQSHPNPPMVYDYYNFPAHTYEVVYPASGQPALAQQVQQLLEQAGFDVQQDAERGFDHGAFVPAYVMYPDASIPMVQLSIDAHYDPAFHLRMGAALRTLRDEDVLILGSGASYHNLRLMGPEAAPASQAFDAWLDQTLLHTPALAREQALLHWDQAPGARVAHTREDHLVPLFVVAGAATEQDPVTRILNSTSTTGIMNGSYRFG